MAPREASRVASGNPGIRISIIITLLEFAPMVARWCWSMLEAESLKSAFDEVSGSCCDGVDPRANGELEAGPGPVLVSRAGPGS